MSKVPIIFVMSAKSAKRKENRNQRREAKQRGACCRRQSTKLIGKQIDTKETVFIQLGI
jgi:hypothetical protein